MKLKGEVKTMSLGLNVILGMMAKLMEDLPEE